PARGKPEGASGGRNPFSGKRHFQESPLRPRGQEKPRSGNKRSRGSVSPRRANLSAIAFAPLSSCFQRSSAPSILPFNSRTILRSAGESRRAGSRSLKRLAAWSNQRPKTEFAGRSLELVMEPVTSGDLDSPCGTAADLFASWRPCDAGSA